MRWPPPHEFRPLPYFPWDSRPDYSPRSRGRGSAPSLDKGNLNAAAARLKVTVARLNKVIRKSPRLQRLKAEFAGVSGDCALPTLSAGWMMDARRPQAHSRRSRRRRRSALDHGFGPLLFKSPLSREFPLPLSRPLYVPLRRDFPLDNRPGPFSIRGANGWGLPPPRRGQNAQRPDSADAPTPSDGLTPCQPHAAERGRSCCKARLPPRSTCGRETSPSGRAPRPKSPDCSKPAYSKPCDQH